MKYRPTNKEAAQLLRGIREEVDQIKEEREPTGSVNVIRQTRDAVAIDETLTAETNPRRSARWGGIESLAVPDGLLAHYDPSLLSAVDGDRIAVLPDLSGSPIPMSGTPTVGEPPIYRATGLNGHPALRFEMDEELTIDRGAGNEIDSAITIFVVCHIEGGDDSLAFVYDGTTPDDRFAFYHRRASDEFRGFSHGNNQPRSSGWSTPPPEPVVVAHRSVPGSTSTLWLNGEVIGTGRGGSQSFRTLRLGGSNQRPLFTGTIGEVVLYNRGLTVGEIEGVSGQLAGRWLADVGGSTGSGSGSGLDGSARTGDDWGLCEWGDTLVIEDFETEQWRDNWTAASSWELVSDSNAAFGGSGYLRRTSTASDGDTARSTTGLPYYPRVGDAFRTPLRAETANTRLYVIWGYQDESNYYFLEIRGDGGVWVRRQVTGSFVELTDQTFHPELANHTGWVVPVIDWRANGNHRIAIYTYERAGAGKDDRWRRITTKSFRDASVAFSAGGFGYRMLGISSGAVAGRVDYPHIIRRP